MADMSGRPRWRLTRSTANLHEAARSSSVASKASYSAPTPTQTPKLERSSSRMSLFNLFSKPKVEKARGHTEVGLAIPMRPQTPPKPAPVSIPKSSLRQNPSPPAQQTIRARASQRFRPMSIRPTLSSQNEFGDWEPPPLFQAFHQSIKHGSVQACVFAPEVLMRTQSQRRQAESLRERIDIQRELSTITENSSETRKLEKTHKRLVSNSVLNPPTPELVNKIYILVTAGYILQYSGHGTFDRMPEKVLKLGKESAAFACDLIPGKHWVLQISSDASGDGAVDVSPRNSLLTRLRSQNLTTRKLATSMLLVLESAEEMDEWMTSVRKEIDHRGGTRVGDDFTRTSSSTDRASIGKNSEVGSHRSRISRDAQQMGKIVPIEPRLSASPKIITSDWESNPEQSKRSIDSSSGYSVRQSSRLSVEMSSVTSTPVSQHQIQLDQLRGRPRHSFMSSATSVSGAGTRNTSRDSSPAPQSPLMEEFGVPGDNEPLRSAMSLRSFQMNPNNTMSSRRRSMQPLPTTNENILQSAEMPPKSKRHSLYSVASPTASEFEKQLAAGPSVPMKHVPASGQPEADAIGLARSSPPQVKTNIPEQPVEVNRIPNREDSPVRLNGPAYSLPPRGDVISPPPKEPAPIPPPVAQRLSILGPTPAGISNPAPYLASTSKVTGTRVRTSGSPKPFLRPIPVRPQAQHVDSSRMSRRQSAQTSPNASSTIPLKTSRSVTAPIRSPSATPNMTPTTSPHGFASMQANTLRRPSSLQVRSDKVPFVSTRPVRLISSTPSFVPGRRMSSAPTPPSTGLQSMSSVEALRQRTLAQQNEQKTIVPKSSLSSIRLPPPAPPPNMPLPPPPSRNIPSPTPPPNVPLPPPPPNAGLRAPPLDMPLPLSLSHMGLPAPPPTMPLPPTPPEVASRATVI